VAVTTDITLPLFSMASLISKQRMPTVFPADEPPRIILTLDSSACNFLSAVVFFGSINL
jgi:hypothetical protein